jgi:hypothetical protein
MADALDRLTTIERLDALVMSECHIVQSELNITAQRDRIAQSEKAGRDTTLSRSLLTKFEATLKLRYAYRARALRDLNG